MSKSGIRVAFASSILFAAIAVAPAQAQSPGSSGHSWEKVRPVVTFRADGAGWVNLRNGCVVSYNWFGTRISGTRRCTPAMRAFSDRVFREELRRRG